MGQSGSLFVGGVQWDSVCKEKKQISFDNLSGNYTPFPHKTLVHKNLKSFLDTPKKFIFQGSSNIIEVIRAVLNSFFLQKDFTHTYRQNIKCKNKK